MRTLLFRWFLLKLLELHLFTETEWALAAAWPYRPWLFLHLKNEDVSRQVQKWTRNKDVARICMSNRSFGFKKLQIECCWACLWERWRAPYSECGVRRPDISFRGGKATPRDRQLRTPVAPQHASTRHVSTTHRQCPVVPVKKLCLLKKNRNLEVHWSCSSYIFF